MKAAYLESIGKYNQRLMRREIIAVCLELHYTSFEAISAFTRWYERMEYGKELALV